MKFQGGGSSHISTANYPSALESLKALGFEIDYAEGYPTDIGNVSEKGYEEALELAKKAAAEKRPLLFFCGLTEEFEGEGFDRETIALPQVQTKLLDKILETGYNDPQFLEGRQPKMLMYGKVSQENYVELTAASAIPNKEIKSPQILRY